MSRTLLSRSFICERLRISRWQSHRLFGKADVRGRIFDATVLAALRLAAANGQPVGDFIPADLLTPDALAAELGVERGWVIRLVRSRRKRPPHFRINKSTIRFSRTDFTRWIDSQARKRKKGIAT